MEIVPISLGVELNGGAMLKIIMKNNVYPCSLYTTVKILDLDETALSINVFHGERALVKDCHLIGRYELQRKSSSEHSGRRPLSSVKISFDIDAMGLLSITCVENSLVE